MSKIKIDSGSQQWFLRTGESTEFGPIEKNGLKLWAEQARVLPGHQVSVDRVNWVPATSVDFLDMNWFIDEGDGDLKGPLNRLAAEALIKNGKFSEDARVIAAEQVDEPQREEPTQTASRDKHRSQAERPKEQATADAGLSKRERDELRQACDTMAGERDELRRMCDTIAAELKAVTAERNAIAVERDIIAAERETQAATQAEAGRSAEELDDKVKQFEKQIQEAVRARESALQQSRESERSFARLLNEANQRDTNYKAQIEALKKTNALSPEATARFYSDQNALFQILKREEELITKTMETERMHLDALKSTATLRLQEMEKQRQALRNLLGNTPVEMTSRALRDQNADPNAVRLRAELDNLRIMHERATRQAEEREWELNYKLKVMKTDYNKLMDDMLKKESESITAQHLADKLSVAERELAELRRNYEAERKQFVANNHAMVARIGELENGFNGAEPGQFQSAEARGVKLASWMSFKK